MNDNQINELIATLGDANCENCRFSSSKVFPIQCLNAHEEEIMAKKLQKAMEGSYGSLCEYYEP